MNFKYVYRTLEEALPNLKLHVSTYTEKEYDYIFGAVNEFLDAYDKIRAVAPFLITNAIAKDFSPLERSDSNYNIFSTKKDQGDRILNTITTLVDATKEFRDYLRPFVESNENENSIDVKLIHIKDLEDLENASKLLKRAFAFPVHELDGEVVIEKVESGSIWLTLGIVAVGTIALQTCANIIWAAQAIRNKEREIKMTEESLRRSKLTNDYMEGVTKHHLEFLKQIREAEAQYVINNFLAGKNTPEALEHMKGSIEAVGTLLEKGTEFHPSLKAPEEIKMLFPPIGLKELIETKTKLLSEGKDEETPKAD